MRSSYATTQVRVGAVPAELFEAVKQAGPLAALLLLFACSGVLFLWKRDTKSRDIEAEEAHARYKESRENYRARIVELEEKNEVLQLARLSEYKDLTGVLGRLSETQLAQASAMQERSKTSTELVDVVRELLVHVKLHLSGLGGRIGS